MIKGIVNYSDWPFLIICIIISAIFVYYISKHLQKAHTQIGRVLCILLASLSTPSIFLAICIVLFFVGSKEETSEVISFFIITLLFLSVIVLPFNIVAAWVAVKSRTLR